VNGLTCRWAFRDPSPPSSGGLVDRVLRARGIDATGAGEFLDPRLVHLHDPSLMPDMDRAAERLLAAIAGGETIAIYGDYDVDGITATAILYHMLGAIAPDALRERVITYVPHRIDEGYGLNAEAITELARCGAKVIVSVDCGVTAIEPARRAREEGVDLIITDHHNALPATPGRGDGESLPDAFAVVHPRRAGSRYPFGDLSGAGVAYKLAWRLATMHERSARLSPALRSLLIDLLAFAALGTIADVVPLVGENRVIARFGLGRIKQSPFVGLRALVEASGLGGESVDAMDVGFKLAPRLNAAGRMGHARDAMELFTTASPERAKVIARELTSKNNERRQVEKAIFAQACAMAEAAGMTLPDRRAIVLSHEDWHAGVVGIVCSRMVERYARPTILLQRRDGVCHGSGRSIDGFNLHGALTACAELLDKHGGHDMAVGLHLADGNFNAFAEAFIAHANRLVSESMLRPLLRADCEARLDELTTDAVLGLNRLEPFGRDNPAVAIVIRGVRLLGPPKTFGSNAKHLSLTLTMQDGGSAGGGEGRVIRVIGWDWAAHAPRLGAGAMVDIVVRPKISTYGGRTTVEPLIEDVCIV